MLGATAGAAAATLTADKMGTDDKDARRLVGGAVGGLVGCLVTGGCSNSDNKLSFGSLVLGGVLGVLGAHLLTADAAKKGKDSKKTASSAVVPAGIKTTTTVTYSGAGEKLNTVVATEVIEPPPVKEKKRDSTKAPETPLKASAEETPSATPANGSTVASPVPETDV